MLFWTELKHALEIYAKAISFRVVLFWTELKLSMNDGTATFSFRVVLFWTELKQMIAASNPP